MPPGHVRTAARKTLPAAGSAPDRAQSPPSPSHRDRRTEASIASRRPANDPGCLRAKARARHCPTLARSSAWESRPSGRSAWTDSPTDQLNLDQPNAHPVADTDSRYGSIAARRQSGSAASPQALRMRLNGPGRPAPPSVRRMPRNGRTSASKRQRWPDRGQVAFHPCLSRCR